MKLIALQLMNAAEEAGGELVLDLARITGEMREGITPRPQDVEAAKGKAEHIVGLLRDFEKQYDDVEPTLASRSSIVEPLARAKKGASK